MEGKFSIPKRPEDVPAFPELIRQILEDKGMSYEELAEKLQITVDELKGYDNWKVEIPQLILKKMSGILGIRYRILRISAGYNTTKWYPDFYLPNGEEIDHEDLLDRIYYKDPSILPQLYTIAFGK